VVHWHIVCGQEPVVAVPLQQHPDPTRSKQVSLNDRRSRVAQRRVQRQKRSLELLQGSLSARRVERQAPWLAGLHRVADGALLATGVAALALAGLTLHWQGRWGRDFRNLQSAQELEHRVLESRSALEQHFLSRASHPGTLVAASSKDLLFMPSPPAQSPGGPAEQPLQLELIASGY
tara:strand:- start:37884 stop:38414 length:531 start_codon:yes stop_codon:yes gene_type:complete